MATLLDALTFLMGDTWEFEFIQRQKSAEKPLQHTMPMPAGLEAVIPYSDGLDSRVVGKLTELQLGKALIRVRIGSGSWDQATLAKQPLAFTSIPYKVQTFGSESAESSARSRGFKFTLISGLASYLSKAQRIVMTESGQGALGPSLVPVGQAYEDFRNHPQFTLRMERFIASLFGWAVRFEFPRLWETKAQTLRLFQERCPDADALIKTRSCWQGSRQVGINGTRRQCGICAACLLRRMSLQAAGVVEPPSNYVWENLRSSCFCGGVADGFPNTRITSSFREYAIAGTLHLDHLANLTSSPLNAKRLVASASSLSTSLGISRSDAESRLALLLKQHAAEWNTFMGSLGNDSFITRWTETHQ
jgi:Queuosine biosynthesis protein QueC